MNRILKIKLCICLFLISFPILSQTENEKIEIVSKINSEALNRLSVEANNHKDIKQSKIEKLTKLGYALEKTIDGKTYKLVNSYNNKPVYQTTYNLDALISTRANFLHTNGGLNLDINGENMLVGEWDQFRALKDHVEFLDNNGDSRVIYGDATPFNEEETGNHGTHIAGTMIASGQNPNAIGMAPAANLISYDWDNDLNEVTNEISLSGLLISNHSYGIPVSDNQGNPNAPTWLMGNYNSDARLWDQLAYASPYYLMIVSAGNDGNSNYTGGLKANFDKLTGEKNAKNNLVIANGRDAAIDANGDLAFPVFINSSSSQGPSDDGRIKPDITANGTEVYSTLNNSTNSYGEMTGTSMSAPNAAGTLVLIQQLYNQQKNQFLLSSTLKALVCHTATDVGNDGPDARFGWGLMDAKSAAETILATSSGQSIIKTEDLSNNQEYTFTVQKDANLNLEVTIAWTDPAGQAKDGQLNSPTPALVNDLDLRISKNNTDYFPWKLDLADVAAPAITGDNTVDNVENIIVESTDNDTYEIKISHKGTLSSPQTVSIIVTGITSSSLSVNSKSIKNEISVWPNPANDFINITSEKSDISDYNINLFDLQGRAIMKNIKSETVNISSLSKGVYILDFRNGNQSFQKKIIKE